MTAILFLKEPGLPEQMLHQLQQPVCLLLMQLLLILSISRLFALLFMRLKQPAVIGELVAGVFLGVSFFGLFFPGLYHFIFPAKSLIYLEIISKLGLALFMFIIGMELDLHALKRKAHVVFIISASSMTIPFLLGFGLAFFLFPLFASKHVQFLPFALFVGLSFGITAFPVLAGILKSRSLIKTSLGLLTISLAATIDVMAWCLLALIIVIAKSGNLSQALFTIIGSLAYIFMMFFIVRPFLQNIISKIRTAHYGDSNIIALTLIVLLFSAFIAELIGIHMLFGAFLAGVIMPSFSLLKEQLIVKIEDLSTHLFLPIFFTLTGLRLQLGLIDSTFLVMLCAGITVIAIAGKFIGTSIPARLSGMNWNESLQLGALMNTRGLMGAVVLNIGYELGLFSAELFAILMLMALVTTLITCPLLDGLALIFKNKNQVNL